MRRERERGVRFVGLVLVLTLAGCTPRPSLITGPKVESESPFVQLGRGYDTQTFTEIVVLCDTERGHLVYVSDGSYSGGIAVIEGGCR